MCIPPWFSITLKLLGLINSKGKGLIFASAKTTIVRELLRVRESWKERATQTKAFCNCAHVWNALEMFQSSFQPNNAG